MRIPTATYRLQFNHVFRFQDARSILNYLCRLNITDIYASPVFCANPKSLHGYDMTDPTRLNSCARTLLKMTCPGVPDFYQGTECWDLNLVDPDNRRPVDYPKQIHLMDQLIGQEKDRSELMDRLFSWRAAGLMKLFVIRESLHLRQRLSELFAQGDYIPLPTAGTYKDHIISYARVQDEKFVLVTVPRLIRRLISPGQMPLGETVWKDTRVCIPQRLQQSGKDIFTGRKLNLGIEVHIAQMLEQFPVSLICHSD